MGGLLAGQSGAFGQKGLQLLRWQRLRQKCPQLIAFLSVKGDASILAFGTSTISGNNAVPVINTASAPEATLLTPNALAITNGSGAIGAQAAAVPVAGKR